MTPDLLRSQVCRSSEEILSTHEEWKAAMLARGGPKTLMRPVDCVERVQLPERHHFLAAVVAALPRPRLALVRQVQESIAGTHRSCESPVEHPNSPASCACG